MVVCVLGVRRVRGHTWSGHEGMFSAGSPSRPHQSRSFEGMYMQTRTRVLTCPPLPPLQLSSFAEVPPLLQRAREGLGEQLSALEFLDAASVQAVTRTHPLLRHRCILFPGTPRVYNAICVLLCGV